MLPLLTDPLRVLLLEHDVVFLVARGDPAGRAAAGVAALRVLELLVPA